jgi:hypothetical protein
MNRGLVCGAGRFAAFLVVEAFFSSSFFLGAGVVGVFLLLDALVFILCVL